MDYFVLDQCGYTRTACGDARLILRTSVGSPEFRKINGIATQLNESFPNRRVAVRLCLVLAKAIHSEHNVLLPKLHHSVRARLVRISMQGTLDNTVRRMKLDGGR